MATLYDPCGNVILPGDPDFDQPRIPVKLVRNGHWEQVENHRGDTFSDDTVWYHVVEFDDGATKRYLPGDPDLRDLIAEIENQNEAAASRNYEGGRDFSPPYEP